MLQTAYQLVDTFWVGRLSAEAVAAVSFCFPISFLLIALGGGLPIAGTVLLAQYTGRGDDDAMNHVAAQTLLMVFLISLVLAAIGYTLATPMMHLMGAAPDVLPDAVRFFQIAVLGFIFVFAFFAYQALMRGRGDRLPADVHCIRHGGDQLRPGPAVDFRLGTVTANGRGRFRDGDAAHPGAGRRHRPYADGPGPAWNPSEMAQPVRPTST